MYGQRLYDVFSPQSGRKLINFPFPATIYRRSAEQETGDARNEVACADKCLSCNHLYNSMLRFPTWRSSNWRWQRRNGHPCNSGHYVVITSGISSAKKCVTRRLATNRAPHWAKANCFCGVFGVEENWGLLRFSLVFSKTISQKVILAQKALILSEYLIQNSSETY